MRIIVISDTHRDFRTLHRIVEKHREEAAMFLHLGDGEQEVDDLLALYPELPLLAVRGNCDYSGERPESRVAVAGNTRIFMAHGHDLGVKGSTAVLVRLARENGCRIALYGHTHKSDTHYEEGIYVMNPGSPSMPRNGRASYGIIDITSAGVVTFVVEI